MSHLREAGPTCCMYENLNLPGFPRYSEVNTSLSVSLHVLKSIMKQSYITSTYLLSRLWESLLD